MLVLQVNGNCISIDRVIRVDLEDDIVAILDVAYVESVDVPHSDNLNDEINWNCICRKRRNEFKSIAWEACSGISEQSEIGVFEWAWKSMKR